MGCLDTYHTQETMTIKQLFRAIYSKKIVYEAKKYFEWMMVRKLLIISWRQEIVRKNRWKFWKYLFNIYSYN